MIICRAVTVECIGVATNVAATRIDRALRDGPTIGIFWAHRDGTTNDQLVERFLKLVESGVINVVVIGGVRDEIQHRQTPRNVTAVFLPRIFNLRPGLNHPAKMRTPNSCCLDLDQNSLRTGFDKR